MPSRDAKALQTALLATPTDLEPDAVRDVAGALNVLLADMIALYLKTKNFHWHVSAPHFRDYHLMLDEQSDQIFATTDDIAERVRKIGATTLRSIGHISRLQRVFDNDADYVTPMSATSMATLRPQACWKVGSMRPSGVVGSCSSRPAKSNRRKLFASVRCWHLADALLSKARRICTPGCLSDRSQRMGRGVRLDPSHHTSLRYVTNDCG
jgi:starvation-inducible DNA-binding protein